METEFVVECPHCHTQIWIAQVNCAIFRHGILKSTGHQIPPHTSKNICDDLLHQNLIWGCGKPFRLFKDDKTQMYYAEKCDYI